MPKTFADSPRLQRVQAATTVYYWSVKNQQLMCVSRDDFKERTDVYCDVCIPSYRGRIVSNEQSRRCHSKFNCLSSFKHHLLICENIFKRPVVWSSKSEVPKTGLVRFREIGDLSKLENEEVLKLKFGSNALVLQRAEILNYFKKHNCPCKDESGERCTVIINCSYGHFFAHISSVERKQKRYVLFKGDASELSSDEVKTQPKTTNTTRKRVRSSQKSNSSRSSIGSSSSTFQMNDSSDFSGLIETCSSPAPTPAKRSLNESTSSKQMPEKKDMKRVIYIAGRKIEIFCRGVTEIVPPKQEVVNNDESSNDSDKETEYIFEDGVRIIETADPRTVQ